MNLRYAATAAVLVPLVLVQLGCGTGKLKLYAVEGKVLVDGQPAADALLIFHPVAKPPGLENPLVARADSSGAFQLTTFEANDGAPAGEYVVTVEWRSPPMNPFDGPGPDKLQGRYFKRDSSQLRVKVEPKATQLEPIQLSTT